MLACPHCALALTLEPTRAVCGTGHSFDRGRGGYLNLLVGGRLGSSAVSGDTAEALAARRRFLTAGHYGAVSDALVDALGTPDGPVLDVGCGEGWYLAQVAAAERYGLDISKAAVQMACRAHPSAQFVVGTATRLPVLDASAASVFSVFSPHVVDELRRVLRPEGRWVTVTPGPDHLREMRRPLQGDAAAKVDDRLRRRTAPPPDAEEAVRVERTLELDAAAAHDLFLMTPMRFQHDEREDGPMTVTLDVWVSTGTKADPLRPR